MKRLFVLLLIVTLLATTGCAGMSARQQRTLSGGAIGACRRRRRGSCDWGESSSRCWRRWRRRRSHWLLLGSPLWEVNQAQSGRTSNVEARCIQVTPKASQEKSYRSMEARGSSFGGAASAVSKGRMMD